VWIVHLPLIAVWNLQFQKQHAGSKGLGMRGGAVSSCWGGSWGIALKYAPKQRLTHDFQLMTWV